MPEPILLIDQLTKRYTSGEKKLTVLDHVSLQIAEGSSFSIVGPSGSGKTTFLGLCAGLDQPSEGRVILKGIDLNSLNEDERAKVRNKYVGFIFQSFNLMPTLTARENVLIPLELRGMRNAGKKADILLGKVGLADRKDHYPAQLSGGEQQRVSIARAFSNDPSILFADEPTGNLDEETGSHIENLIFELNREHNTTLVIVTHDLRLAEKTENIVHMKGGKFVTPGEVAS